MKNELQLIKKIGYQKADWKINEETLLKTISPLFEFWTES